jgi:hypothetical protein
MKRNIKWLQGVLLIAILFISGWSQTKQSEQVLLDKGIKYYKDAKYSDAVDVFSQIKGTSTDRDILFKTYLYWGNISFIIGDVDKAKSYINLTFDYKPEYSLDENEFPSESFIKFWKNERQAVIGIVSFESLPAAAKVYLDGRMIGVTPYKTPLIAVNRKYSIRMVKAGYSVYETVIDLKPNLETTPVIINFNTVKNWKSFVRSAVLMIVLGITMNRI